MRTIFKWIVAASGIVISMTRDLPHLLKREADPALTPAGTTLLQDHSHLESPGFADRQPSRPVVVETPPPVPPVIGFRYGRDILERPQAFVGPRFLPFPLGGKGSPS
jgi:hypothetical protein